jgi:hypothetical protein
MTEERPVGQRFSQIYLEKGKILRDSLRFRNRLRALFDDIDLKMKDLNIAKEIERETGINVPFVGYGRDWRKFWTESDIRDVLDSITIIFNTINSSGYSYRAKDWLDTISRFFVEENVGYSLDSGGGVHFAIDHLFERERSSTLVGLTATKYGAVRHSFEKAFNELDKSPTDYRAAVRSIFDALENFVKLWFPDKISRLGAKEIETVIKPSVIANRTGADRDSAGLLLKGLADWVNAAHQYRHVSGTEKDSPPPLGTTVLFLSTGAAYLRWLIEVRESRI